jgi:ATP-dependent RNA helicase RhlE
MSSPVVHASPSVPADFANLSSQFTQLGLSAPLLRAVAETGYTTPTPIQAKAIPQVLQGGDLLAAAQTGTGKTAGFTLPILHRLTTTTPAISKPGRPRCLILVPTRELAAQVEESVRTYGKHVTIKSMVMFGGVNINPQFAALRGKVDILVATPGRLLDHVGQKTVDLSGIEILVLDEADRMLDMGFIRDIKKVIALIPKQRQTLLFSATFSDEIKLLANGLLNNPGTVEVARRNTASELVEQSVHMVAQAHKKDLLSHLIRQHNWQQVLVFTRTKHGANKLAEKLIKDNIPTAAIHGNKSQAARTRALADFKSNKLQVLVATDIAARGIDIDQLPQVVNFELPNVPEDYVHRIGRTGRAGTSGAAVSLVDREELGYLRDIERLMKREIAVVVVEDFVPPPTPVGGPVDRLGARSEDERPPRQPGGRGQGGRQERGDGRGQGRAKPGVPKAAMTTTRTAARPGTPNTAVPHLPRPPSRPAAATGAPTPNRRESHNAAHHVTHRSSHAAARPQAALFSAKPVKPGS